MQRGDAAVRAVLVAPATAHQKAGGHSGDGVNPPGPFGEGQSVQVVQGSAFRRESNLAIFAVGDSSNLRQVILQIRGSRKYLRQGLLSLVNHDDVEFGMVLEQRLCGARSVMSA